MVRDMNHQTKNVCVIGAGPSGLVAARELRKEGHKVVVMEQNHDIGGQWLYDPKVEGEDPLGRATIDNKFLKVHSSIYESLRLTSPREIMGYTDFPFVEKKGRDMRRFPSHRELFLYLKDFCDHFGLRGMIRFNTRVEYVSFMADSDDRRLRWVVKSRDVRAETVVEEVFDAVVVASGHYSQPRVPAIRGTLYMCACMCELRSHFKHSRLQLCLLAQLTSKLGFLFFFFFPLLMPLDVYVSRYGLLEEKTIA